MVNKKHVQAWLNFYSNDLYNIIFDRDLQEHLAYMEHQVKMEKKLVINLYFSKDLRGFGRRRPIKDHLW